MTYTAFCHKCEYDTKWQAGVCLRCGVNANGVKTGLSVVEIATLALQHCADGGNAIAQLALRGMRGEPEATQQVTERLRAEHSDPYF